MDREKIANLYNKYGLAKEDVFKHQNYLIITRTGIEKIQAFEKINVSYEVVECQPKFACVKAIAHIEKHKWIETFGSALKGDGFRDGNCITWYVMEMAEKRALSRAVLKVTGFYELGVFGEDESEEFKISSVKSKKQKKWEV